MIADQQIALRTYARDAARMQGIDADVFERQIAQESGFNPNAKSPAGAIGIAQFMPGTAKSVGLDPTDPYASLDAAAKLMRSYVDRFGSYQSALIAYNAGPGRVTEGDPSFLPISTILSDVFAGGETKRYVAKILGNAAPPHGGGGGSSSATGGSSSPSPSIGELPTCGLDAASMTVVGDRLRFGQTPAQIAAELTKSLGRTITVECLRGDAYRAAGEIGRLVDKATSIPVLGGAAQTVAGSTALAKNAGELIALATKPENLWRVAFTAAGVVLIVAGARLYLRHPAEAHTESRQQEGAPA